MQPGDGSGRMSERYGLLSMRYHYRRHTFHLPELGLHRVLQGRRLFRGRLHAVYWCHHGRRVLVRMS